MDEAQPGDPMPVKVLIPVRILMRGDKYAGNETRPAGDYRWSTIEYSPRAEIIGWCLAGPPQEKDELIGAIQKLTSTPGISAESLALIEAAKAVQSGSMTFAEAIATLSPFTDSK